MSIEEGSAPNSGSGGSIPVILGTDELEDPTTDLASFACLLARTSAKDIRDRANKHKHGRFHSKVLLLLFLRISLHLPPYSLPSHLQIMYSLTAGLRSSGYPQKSESMISVYEYIVRLLWHIDTYQARANINNIFWNEEDQCIHFSRNRDGQFRCGKSARCQFILVFHIVSANTPF